MYSPAPFTRSLVSVQKKIWNAICFRKQVNESVQCTNHLVVKKNYVEAVYTNDRNGISAGESTRGRLHTETRRLIRSYDVMVKDSERLKGVLPNLYVVGSRSQRINTTSY